MKIVGKITLFLALVALGADAKLRGQQSAVRRARGLQMGDDMDMDEMDGMDGMGGDDMDGMGGDDMDDMMEGGMDDDMGGGGMDSVTDGSVTGAASEDDMSDGGMGMDDMDDMRAARRRQKSVLKGEEAW